MAIKLKDNLRSAGTTAGKAVSKAGKKVAQGASDLRGPSPNPHTNLIIADVALRGSATLMRQAVERGMLGTRYAPKKAKAILKGRSLTETLLHTVIARVATRSIPGALVVGGGLLAKTLYDRGVARRANLEGEIKLQEMASKGTDTEE